MDPSRPPDPRDVTAAWSPEAPRATDRSTIPAGSPPQEPAETLASGADPALLQAGDLRGVPGYELLDELGRGGMGVVYLARQTGLKRLVALKMILGGAHASREQLARFRLEAEAVASLTHPNIVQIHEIGEHDRLPYFSLEYVGGGSLAQKCHGTPQPPQKAAALVETLARAMQSAHERGVVHRDLKPANVLLAEDGTPKITDFGLAKHLGQDSGQTASGQVMGTPSYMAPEQAAGHASQIGPLSDVYALGAILYWLLAGRPPFQSANVVETLKQVIEREPVSPRQLNPEVDRDLETICLKCLQKRPQDRFRSAAELAEELARFRSGEPIRSRRLGPATRLWRWCKRKPLAAALVAAVMLIALSIGASLVVYGHAERTRQLAELNNRLETGLERLELSEDSLARLEQLTRQMDRLLPEQAEQARERLYRRFAGLIEARIRQPRVGGDLAQIEAGLAALQRRNAAAAQRVRQELEQRLLLPDVLFDVRGPFRELPAVLDPRDATLEQERLVSTGAGGRTSRPALMRDVSCQGDVALEAVFAPGWQQSGAVGLALNAGGGKGYLFLLERRGAGGAAAAGGAPTERAGETTPAAPAARESTAAFEAQILRNGAVLRRQELSLGRLGSEPLRLRAARDGETLALQVNGLPEIRFQDLFGLSATEPGAFGLVWPAGVELLALEAQRRALPPEPSPLERGDELFGREAFGEALAFYRREAISNAEARFRQEARLKEALCLLRLNREDEAVPILTAVAAEEGDRWPPLAGCQLWALHLKQQRMAEAENIFQVLTTKYTFNQLAPLIPEEIRTSILQAADVSGFQSLTAADHNIDELERALQVAQLFAAPQRGELRRQLIRAYRFRGDWQQAIRLTEQWVEETPVESNSPWGVDMLARLMLETGQPQRGQELIDRYLREPDGQYRPPHTPLLLERARLLVAMGREDEAARDLETMLEIYPAVWRNTGTYAEAHLLLGLLRERAGQGRAAQALWRAGMEIALGRRAEQPGVQLDLWRWMTSMMLASLVNEPMTDAEVFGMMSAVALSRTGNDAALSMLLKNNSLRDQLFPVALLRQGLRTMWRSPRGRELCWRLAFRTVEPQDEYRLPMVMMAYAVLNHSAFGEHWTAEQEALVYQTALELFDGYTAGKIQTPQIFQAAMAWKGRMDQLGWKGLAPALEPPLRGRVAYVFGHRYLRLGKATEAAELFATAEQAAPPDSPLARLARYEREHADDRRALEQLRQEVERLPAGAEAAAVEALREKVSRFLAAHHGTPLEPLAGALVLKLPAPADALAREKIPVEKLVVAGGGDPAQAPPEIVAILGEGGHGHWQGIVLLAGGGDLSVVASVGWDRAVRLWDGKERRFLRLLPAEDLAPPFVLAVSADGTRVATGNHAGAQRLKVWDSATGEQLAALDDAPAEITLNHAAFSPDGRWIAGGCADGTVRLWDVAGSPQPRVFGGHRGAVSAVAFDGQGERIASASADQTIHVRERVGGRVLQTFSERAEVRSVAFGPDRAALAYGCADGRAVTVPLSGGPAREFAVGGQVIAVGFSAGGSILTTYSDHGHVKLWDLASGELRQTIGTGGFGLVSTAGDKVLAGGWDGRLRLWEVESGQEVPEAFGLPMGPAGDVAWSPDGRSVAYVLRDGRVRLWDVSQQKLSDQPLHGSAWRLAFDATGKQLFSAGHNGSLKQFLLEAGQPGHDFKGHEQNVRGLAVSADGSQIASGDDAGVIKLWNTQTGEEIGSIAGSGPVYGLAFSPKGEHLAAGAEGGVRLYELKSGAAKWTAPDVPDAVRSVAFSPDGRWLYFAGHASRAGRLDAESGQLVLTYQRHLESLEAVALRPDGQLLATAGNDGRLRLFHPDYNEPLAVLRLAPSGYGKLTRLAFGPEGRYLAVGNYDGSIYLLRLEER